MMQLHTDRTRRTDPAEAAADALLLLVSGRVSMAKTLLEPLPAAIRTALEAERQGTADELEQRRKAAARNLAVVQRALAEAEAALANVKAETRRLEAQDRDLRARIERRRQELAGLAEAVTARKRDLARRREPRPAPVPPASKPYQLLAAALAEGRVTAERVAELLKLRVDDVLPIAAGRVGLGKSTCRQLLAELPACAAGNCSASFTANRRPAAGNTLTEGQ
jgi:hypothetical protein